MKKRFTPCAAAILRTLSYRSIFKYPLSIYQLATFLISDKPYKIRELEQALELLVRRHYAKEKNGLYSAYTTRTVDWKARAQYSQEFIKQNMWVLKLLGNIPWILLVGVTGSTAAYNALGQSDLDVLIVVRKNRLWVSRFFVVLLLKLVSKYPTKDGEPGKICPNMYLDEERLAWRKEHQNIYVAHDMLLMQPVINKKNAYLRLLQANGWVFTNFANYVVDLHTKLRKVKTNESFLFDWLDTVFMWVQVWYMKSKKTTEIAQKNFLHFNKYDNSSHVLHEYGRILAGKKLT